MMMEWDPFSPGVTDADEDDCWERTWESSSTGREGEEPAGADWSPWDRRRSNPKINKLRW